MQLHEHKLIFPFSVAEKMVDLEAKANKYLLPTKCIGKNMLFFVLGRNITEKDTIKEKQ